MAGRTIPGARADPSRAGDPRSSDGKFRILVTANAFMESGDAAAGPLLEAGAEVVPAPRAAGFSMIVLAHDPGVAAGTIAAAGARPVSLSELLAADFVTLHAALIPETARMIDESALRAMKSTAYLINAARGGLIDEAA